MLLIGDSGTLGVHARASGRPECGECHRLRFDDSGCMEAPRGPQALSRIGGSALPEAASLELPRVDWRSTVAFMRRGLVAMFALPSLRGSAMRSGLGSAAGSDGWPGPDVFGGLVRTSPAGRPRARRRPGRCARSGCCKLRLAAPAEKRRHGSKSLATVVLQVGRGPVRGTAVPACNDPLRLERLSPSSPPGAARRPRRRRSRRSPVARLGKFPFSRQPAPPPDHACHWTPGVTRRKCGLVRIHASGKCFSAGGA